MICRNFTLITVFLFFSTYSLDAQTLFTYGNKPVSKAEFLRAYQKNNTDSIATEQSYRQYFDLFTKFKIKVQAAKDMKLDTLTTVKAELQNYRTQIVENFLNDEGSIQDMIDEAFTRSQKDIRLAHIFIPIHKEDTIDQKQKAEAKINKAYEALKLKSFEEVALEYSEDPSVKTNKGDIGYVTAFVLPYVLENLAYSLSEGQHSKPTNSGMGFHIFKNLKERKGVGRLRAAQVLISFPPEATSAQEDSVKRLADSLQTVLINGGDFKSLALQFSHDNLSYQNGGELPEFGVGRHDPVFESAAFSLQKDGEISKPVKTSFGYHIIKRISHAPVPKSKEDKQWRDQAKQQILQNDRMQISREKLIKNIQEKTAFKKLTYNPVSLWRITDSILSNKEIPVLKDINNNTELFSYSHQTVRVKDWINYLESVRGIPSLTLGKSNADIFKQFIETSTLDYYRNHLEDFNSDFVMELNEFKEGNLLFEVMQRKIWDVATNDSVGLQTFYKANSNKYWWENSADAIIFTCSDQLEAEKLKTGLKSKVADWRKFVENSNGSIQADSGRFELGQIPVPDRTNFAPGLITADVKNGMDSSVTFSYIIKLYNTREPRNFEDARGFVLNDYQEYLENEWVAGLKKKYPTKLNQEVFNSLPK